MAVLAESTPLEDIAHGQKTKHCRCFKMKELDGYRAEDVSKVLQENLAEKTIVFPDKSKRYVDIAQYVEAYIWQKSTKETTAHELKWVHIAIANAKRTLLGVYHKMSGKHCKTI